MDAFAQAMEERLKANDHKGGWKGCQDWWLMQRVHQELNEMSAVLIKLRGLDGDQLKTELLKGQTLRDLRHEAADVANFVMMIVDVFDALEVTQ